MVLIKSIMSLNKEVKFDCSVTNGELFLQIPFFAVTISMEIIKDE